MLYIHYNLNDGSGLKEKEWHVGDKSPSDLLDDSNLIIESVYADGHELAHIEAYFKNIPFTKEGRSCVWRGDLARFIFDNL